MRVVVVVEEEDNTLSYLPSMCVLMLTSYLMVFFKRGFVLTGDMLSQRYLVKKTLT
jgi:hypothetical protein